MLSAQCEQVVPEIPSLGRQLVVVVPASMDTHIEDTGGTEDIVAAAIVVLIEAVVVLTYSLHSSAKQWGRDHWGCCCGR